jgi:hypothetical protein
MANGMAVVLLKQLSESQVALATATKSNSDDFVDSTTLPLPSQNWAGENPTSKRRGNTSQCARKWAWRNLLCSAQR